LALEEVLIGFAAGAVGSCLMWLLVAPQLIIRFGRRAIETWIDRNIPEDPDAAGAAHQSLDPRILRVTKFFTWYTGRTIAGVFGDLEKRIGDELASKGPEIAQKALQGGAPGLAQLASQFAGSAKGGGKSPWGGLTEIFSLLSTLQQIGGALGAPGSNGGAGVAALPAHPFLQR
jgi:hypothetical protein